MKHKYKYGILAAALASALFGAPSFAASTSTSSSGSTATGVGTANNAGIGTSSSNSGSSATSGSVANGGTSNGYAGSVVNFTYTGDPSSGAGTGGGAPTLNENISGTQRLVTVGAAIAPSIYSNNVCALSASAAGGFMGGAFALGFDRIDKDCNIRANASLLGHFAEIYAIAAEHSPDPAVRQLAEREAAIYAQWANNYLCMTNPDVAAAAPPDARFCKTVATQAGLQVVPAPVATYVPPKQVAAIAPTPIADPPPKPAPRAYEAVSTSVRTGPINGYNGPDYSDDFKD